jgi:hypothetical protein
MAAAFAASNASFRALRHSADRRPRGRIADQQRCARSMIGSGAFGTGSVGRAFFIAILHAELHRREAERGKRHLLRVQLPQQNAKRVDVGATVVVAVGQHLGRRPLRRADVGRHRSTTVSVDMQPRSAEIAHFDRTVRAQEAHWAT